MCKSHKIKIYDSSAKQRSIQMSYTSPHISCSACNENWKADSLLSNKKTKSYCV